MFDGLPPNMQMMIAMAQAVSDESCPSPNGGGYIRCGDLVLEFCVWPGSEAVMEELQQSGNIVMDEESKEEYENSEYDLSQGVDATTGQGAQFIALRHHEFDDADAAEEFVAAKRELAQRVLPKNPMWN